MWVHFALLFLAGTALADTTLWKPKHVYHYIVRSRVLTGQKLSEQVSGMLIRTQLSLGVMPSGELVADLTDMQYSPIHKTLTGGWDAAIPDNELNYANVPPLKSPIKVTLHQGEIDEIFAHPEERTSLVNFIKGILSQLQLQLDRKTRLQLRAPGENHDIYRTYDVEEQTVSGSCGTTYDISPLAEAYDVEVNNLPTDIKGDYLRIWKHRNYENCTHAPSYRFTISDETQQNLYLNYITRSSSSNTVATHKNGQVTILSSLMKSMVDVRPKVNDMENIRILNIINTTLVKIESDKEILAPTNIISIGNLSYTQDESNTLHDFPHFSQPDSTSEESSESMENHDKNNMPHENSASNSALITEANLLIHDVATGIMQPDEIIEQKVLEKYTVLTKIIRHLREPDLTTLQSKVFLPQLIKQDEKKSLAWKVFRDAVTQAGTLSALKTIRFWITTKKITGQEAAYIIGQIPRAARQPTPEYIKTFYNFINTPLVKNQAFLNTTAPYAFSELLRYALVWDSEIFYSTPSMTENVKQELKETYLNYLTDELTKAYEEKYDNRIVTYIIALGNLADPKVIQVFEPYLEGKKPITTFQRTIMVGALKRLCDQQDELIGPIVNKIYQNEKESNQVRVMAVNVLLQCNPSKSMLRLMAERTKNELDTQVNNAIISGIKSLAELNGEKYEEVAKNAIYAKTFLNSEFENIRRSANIMHDYVDEQKDVTAWLDISTVGKEARNLPNIVDIKLGTNYSSFSPPAFQLQAALTKESSLLQAIRLLFNRFTEKHQTSNVDTLAETLNIMNNEEEATEGSLLVSNEYLVQLFVLDENTLEDLKRNFLLTSMTNLNTNYLANSILSSEILMSYPSEIGIPINYQVLAPILFSVRNKVDVRKEQNNMQIGTNLDVTVSRQVIKRLTVLGSFNQQMYVSGIDVNTQMRLPVSLNIQTNSKENGMRIEMKPLPRVNQATLWEERVLPYTGKCETLSLNSRSIRSSKNSQLLIVGKIDKTEMQIGPFTITRESDHFKPTIISPTINNFQTLLDNGLNILNTHVLVALTLLDPLHYQQLKVKMNVNPREDNRVIFSLNYDNLLSLNSKEKRPENIEKLLTKVRNNKLYKNNLDNTYYSNLNVQLQVPKNNVNYQCNGSMIELGEPLLSEIYVNCDLTSDSSTKLWKVCAQAEINNAPSDCPIMQQTIDTSHDYKISKLKASIRYGEDCQSGEEINVQATHKQSEDTKKKLTNLEISKQIEGEMNAGGKISTLNSEEVCKVIDYMDEFTVSVKMNPEKIETLNQLALKLLINQVVPGANINFVKSLRKDSSRSTSDIVNLSIRKPIDSETLNVAMNSPPLIIHVPLDLTTEPVARFFHNQINSLWGFKDNINLCVATDDKIKTFDNTIFPITSSKCPRVLVINAQYAPYNHVSTLPLEETLAILYQDQEKGQRILIIKYQNQEYKLQISDNKLFLNEELLTFNGGTNTKNHLPLNIAHLRDSTYKITIEPAGFVVWFVDSTNIIIQAPDTISGNMRGLCGTLSGNRATDLVDPQGCTKKSEHVVALYTVHDNTCHDEIVTKQRKEAEAAECNKIEYRQTDVVETDQEEEEEPVRHPMQNTCVLLRTDVRTNEAGKICFSSRPILQCTENCISENTISKEVPYHCVERIPEIIELQRRIELGANPDLSKRTVNAYYTVQMPKHCHY